MDDAVLESIREENKTLRKELVASLRERDEWKAKCNAMEAEFKTMYKEYIKAMTKIAHYEASSIPSPTTSFYNKAHKKFREEIHEDSNGNTEDKEVKEKISELRDWLLNYYQDLDSKQNNSDYSYKEEFSRLEKHLSLLPKHTKYDISTLLEL